MISPKCSPTTPQKLASAVWAIPFSLATTWGITIVFFSSPYLDVSVQEVGSLSSIPTSSVWVVPFGDPGIYRLCAAPPGFSQLTTSFFASQTQGIHHAPLFALKIFPHTSLHITYTTIYYNFTFPICQRSLVTLVAQLSLPFADVLDLNQANSLFLFTSLQCFLAHLLTTHPSAIPKELLSLLLPSPLLYLLRYLCFVWRISESNR